MQRTQIYLSAAVRQGLMAFGLWAGRTNFPDLSTSPILQPL